jgi:hypothetical protein
MQENIIEFMNKVEIIDKNLSQYKDKEKGISFFVNTVNLLTKVDYLEVGTEKNARLKVAEYEKLLFEKKIEDLDYKKITKKDIRVKSEITGKKEDSTTLIEEEVPAVAIWNVCNTVGVYKSFTTKEEAMKFSDEVNNKVLEKLLS